MLTKDELLEPLARLRGDAVVITCMGVTRPWGRYSSREIDFASADSAMGHTADLALGVALACPQRKVVCLNGDGSMLMSLGTLATVAQAGAENYILFILQNGTYEITGNQPVPGAALIDFTLLARGAGIRSVYAFTDAATYGARLAEVLANVGPTVVVVHVAPGMEGPISRSDRESSAYLKVSLASWGRRMRNALLRDVAPG